MKVGQKHVNNDLNRSATEATQSNWQNQLAQISKDSKKTVAQRAVIDGINDSPLMLAQLRQIESYISTGQQQTTVQAYLTHPVSRIQAKLTIGQLADKYEQEADRVAAQVVKQINTPASVKLTQDLSVQRESMPEETLQTKPILQHREAIGGAAASADLESAINSSRGGGQALDAGLQQSMGQAMGADFSGVRVHTDARANQLNQSMQAKAFTTGQDVFFRQGAYSPRSHGGQELIAHELTHVVQQDSIKDGAISTQSVSDNHIQRAIGVELECTNLHIIESPHSAKKGDVIAGGYQWLMMYETTSAGQSVVEFKTDPPAEFEPEFLSSINGMQQKAAEFDKSTPVTPVKIGSYTIVKEGNIEGDAQITIGVPLEHLPVVYSTFGSLKDTLSHKKYQKLIEDQGDQSEKDPDGNAVKDLPAETKGLILLCIDYIQRGYVPKNSRAKKPESKDYTCRKDYWKAKNDFKESGRPFIKGIFDVMVRTDFQTIFSTLSRSEQDRISYLTESENKREMRENWVDWIVANATRPYDQAKKAFSSAYKDYTRDEINDKKSDKLINHKIKGRSQVGAGPARGDWLRTMPNKDLLSTRGFMGIGQLGVKTDKLEKDNAKAPIYELRAPESTNINYKQWFEKGIKWWGLYFAAVNNNIIKRGK